MTDIVQIVARTRELLGNGENWGKAPFADQQICLGIAMCDALRDTHTIEADETRWIKLCNSVYNVASVIIHEQWPDRVTYTDGRISIVQWNDRKETTYADVELVLEKMIAHEGC